MVPWYYDVYYARGSSCIMGIPLYYGTMVGACKYQDRDPYQHLSVELETTIELRARIENLILIIPCARLPGGRHIIGCLLVRGRLGVAWSTST